MGKLLNNTSIKIKMLMVFCVLIIIPLGILSAIFYSKSSAVIEENMIKIVDLGLEQTEASLSYRFKKCDNIANTIVTNEDIQSILRRGMQPYDKEMQLNDYLTLVKYLSALNREGDILQVRIFVNDGLIYSNQGVNIININSINNEDWYKALLVSDKKDKWSWRIESLKRINEYPREDVVLSFVKVIKDVRDYDKVLGVVAVDIAINDIFYIMKEANFSGKADIYLHDITGKILLEGQDNIRQLGDQVQYGSNDWEIKKINGEFLIINHKSIVEFGWVLTSVMPLKWIRDGYSYLQKYLIILFVIVTVMSFFIAYILSQSSFQRINNMINTMQEVQNSNMDVNVRVDGNDEIGQVEKNFNYMIKQIRKLMDEKYILGIEVKNAELKALQAQINPHFLYNTLDMINWMVMDYEPKETSQLIKTLSAFYKLSLNKGKEYVSVEAELQHVSLYIEIQNRRYDNNIEFIIDVSEHIKQLSVLKLILQPIVENSILHGIMYKKDKSGIITIAASEYDGIVSIFIKDDGIGMSADTVSSILTKNISAEPNGYGVFNINERLKLKYGNQYGLSYESTEGKGTQVEIKFPELMIDKNILTN